MERSLLVYFNRQMRRLWQRLGDNMDNYTAVMITEGVEQAINLAKWGKLSAWAKLAMKLRRNIKPWPYSYYDQWRKK